MSEREIVIEELGPIEHFRIPAPEGGLVELTGHNGAGKSTALEVVKALAGAKPKDLTVRRGAAHGEAYGLGVNITFGRAFRRDGELVVKAMKSDIDPSVLIAPKHVDPEKRDDHRGRMLCAIYGIEPNLDLFSKLFRNREEREKIVSSETAAARTLPEQAKLLKLDFEKHARALNVEHLGLIAKAQSAAGRASQFDLNAPHDPKVLAQAVEDAVRALAAAEGEAVAAKKRGDAWASAKAKLDAASVSLSPFAAKAAQTRIDEGLEQVKAAESELATARAAHEQASATMTVATERATQSDKDAAGTRSKADTEADAIMADAEVRAKAAAQAIMDTAAAVARKVREDASRAIADAKSKADAEVRDAHSKLNEAGAILESRKTQLETAHRQVQAAEKELAQARESEKAVSDVRALVDAGAGDPGPTPEALAKLRDQITIAKNAESLGQRVRDARAARADAEEAQRQAQRVEDAMLAMRDAAAGCWEVVSDTISSVAPQGIRFRDGRLVVDRNGETVLLDELSDGEIITIAIHAIADALGPGGMFTIDQGWWGELQPQRKVQIRDLCTERQILGITARATDGELAATVL